MIIKSCTLLLALFLLSGCATLNIVSFGLSGISFITTGKSLSDHALSAVTDQDCAMHRIIFDESMCRKTNGIIETNGEVVLAKNVEQEGSDASVNPRTFQQVASTEIMTAKAIDDKLNASDLDINVHEAKAPELIAALDKPSTSPSFEINKQQNIIDEQAILNEPPVFNEESIFNEQTNTVAHYKVIGSFNNKSYAITRANLYQDMGAVVIANRKVNGNDNTASQAKTYNTNYRVVLGPYLTDTQLPEIGKIAKTEKSPDWMLSLCTKTLSPPPCVNENITLARTY